MYKIFPIQNFSLQTVPAKEPQFDAIPLKSALKKPLSAQEKHIHQQAAHKTPTQEHNVTEKFATSENKEYAQFESQNESSARY